MKKTILCLMALLLFVGTTRADEYVTEEHTIVVNGDTIYWNQDSKFDSKQIKERMKKAEEAVRKAEERIKDAQERLGKYDFSNIDSILVGRDGKIIQYRSLPDEWSWGHEKIDLPKDQKPLIDLSNIKGRWGFEDYYFSGDILHAQNRRGGDFYISGWNIRPLLHRLSGLLVLKSKKEVAEKIIFSRGTQLRNNKDFKLLVRDRDISVYGHPTKDDQFDEVIILMSREQSPNKCAYIVQMMGLLRPDNLTSYAQLRNPAPNSAKKKQ